MARNNCASCANIIRSPGPCCRAATRAYALRASANWRLAQCAVARLRVTSACAPRTIWPTVRWDRRKPERRPNDRRSPSGSKIVLQTFSAYIRLTYLLIITHRSLLEITHHQLILPPPFFKTNLNQTVFLALGFILLTYFSSNTPPANKNCYQLFFSL